MSYVIKAVLSNSEHPEYGQVTVPFPVPNEEYDDTIALLSPLGIGDAMCQDCQIDDLDSFYTVLNQMLGTSVTFDELDYLAKRLDSFNDGEAAQFQGMAHKLGLSNIKDLINLTFCCQQATVITDFSDLGKIGQEHYMNLNGGCVLTEELENLDGYETALLLIDSGAGVITPYGVVYDNGMKLEQLYDGRHLPGYFYDDSIATVTLSLKGQSRHCEILYFPCANSKIDRALRRLGVQKSSQCLAELDTDMCDAVRGMFEEEFEINEHLETFNALARCYQEFDDKTLDKFHTVFDSVWPRTPEEVLYLAKHIHDFTVVEGISTAEEYGRYMIKESGHFELDPNLEDYERVPEDREEYGKQVLRQFGVNEDALDILELYTDFEQLGEAYMEENGVRQTEFGFVRRISTPFPNQTQSQQSM